MHFIYVHFLRRLHRMCVQKIHFSPNKFFSKQNFGHPTAGSLLGFGYSRIKWKTRPKWYSDTTVKCACIVVIILYIALAWQIVGSLIKIHLINVPVIGLTVLLCWQKKIAFGIDRVHNETHAVCVCRVPCAMCIFMEGGITFFFFSSLIHLCAHPLIVVQCKHGDSV